MWVTGMKSLRGWQRVRRLQVGNLGGRVSDYPVSGNVKNSAAPLGFVKNNLGERGSLPSPSQSPVSCGPSSGLTAQDLLRDVAESIGKRRRGYSISHVTECCFLSARENARVRRRERLRFSPCKLKRGWRLGEKKLP